MIQWVVLRIGVKNVVQSNIIKTTTTRLRMGWCGPSKIVSRPAETSSLAIGTGSPWGRSFPLLLWPSNHPSIYDWWLLSWALMMRAIGEMSIGSWPTHLYQLITKYLGKYVSFRVGLNRYHLFLWMAEITAVSTYAQYWFLLACLGRFRLSPLLILELG